MGLLGAPAVAVYANGLVVGAAQYQARLGDAELRELVGGPCRRPRRAAAQPYPGR